MNFTSTTTLPQALKNMSDDEMGMVLLCADGGYEEEFKQLSEKNHYSERIGGYAGKTLVAYQIYPLNYSSKNPTADILDMRNDAIQNLFHRWNTLGYNTCHAKSPYKSKKFAMLLSSLGFMKADYLLLRVA